MCNIPNQDHVNINAHTKFVTKFYTGVLKILSRNEIMTDGQNDRWTDRMTDNPNPIQPHFEI